LLSSESVAGTILSPLYKFYQRFMMKLKKCKQYKSSTSAPSWSFFKMRPG
jgi:hypothetical protein